MAFPENTVNDTGIKHIWDKVTAALSGKVDKVSGKGLSTNDYTTAEKDKLAGIEAGAQVNTVASVAGKTGAVTLDKSDVGLGNVDNTSDANKPISTATQNALDDKADASEVAGTQTLTGNPITITDAAGINAEALKVTFNPKQDLHGYDFPWVGGAGKNKLDVTTSSSSQFARSGEVFTNTVADTRDFFNLQINDSNTTLFGIAIRSTGVTVSDVFTISNDTSSISIRHSGSQVDLMIFFSQTIKAGSYKLVIDVTGYNSSVVGGLSFKNVMLIPSTETNTDFAPYSNICPITGYTEVGVEDVGINQWDEEWEVGDIDNNGQPQSSSTLIRTKNFNPCKPNTTYRVIKPNASIYMKYYDEDKNFISPTVSADSTITTPANCYYFKFVIGSAYGTTYNHDISINYPSTDHDYHAYQHSSATIPFSQTLYGGVSDFVEGGTEKKYIIKKISDLSWTYRTISGVEGYVFVSNDISDIKQGQSPVMASCYRIKTNRNYIDGDSQVAISNNTSAKDCVIKDDAYTDATTFATARGDETLLFELAEYDSIATPQTELKLLQGTNNITTNGTTINLDYIPNNSIGDAVKASEEYTDRAVERVAPKATLIDTWMISEESDTISVDLTSYDCNFFLLEYLFNSKRGTTLIPRPQGGSFSVSVVTYNNGSALYIELDYNPTTKELAYTSNVTSQFGILAIYTI